jgi:hypothetical protein
MSEGRSFSRFGVHVGTDWRVYCHGYPDAAPILDLDFGPTSIGLSIEGREVSDEAVRFAREFAREAQRFAAEVERVHAERQESKAAEGSAA